jgi:F0F1-type ATP synthase epsilon subunit
MDATQRLQIKVLSPYQTFYEGAGVSLTATNTTGPFDILYNHSNFFSLLLPGRVVVETGFERIEIQIESGFIKVSNNIITLFANI